MFCKKGHKDITKRSIREDQSAEQTGKTGTTVQLCILLHHFFYTEANSNKYNNNFLSSLSADYCIPGNVILTSIKLNSYICLFEKFQLFHYCHTANLNQATLTAYYSIIINLPVFHFLIPVGFILGQAEKEGKGGFKRGVVHII